MNTNQFEEYKRPVTPSVVENLPPSPNRNSFQWRNPSESNGEMINGVESRQRRLDVLNWSPSRITKKRAKEAQKQNLTATTSSKFIIDGDFDFDRPPSRQRSESLFRRVCTRILYVFCIFFLFVVKIAYDSYFVLF